MEHLASNIDFTFRFEGIIRNFLPDEESISPPFITVFSFSFFFSFLLSYLSAEVVDLARVPGYFLSYLSAEVIDLQVIFCLTCLFSVLLVCRSDRLTAGVAAMAKD